MQRAAKASISPPVGRWGKREQGILEVATELFAQGGYETITMAAVASAAGLSEGTLYNYFRDKQDLQLRVSLGVFQDYTLEMEQVVANSTSLRQGLEAIIAIELRLLIEAKELFRVWLREVRSSSGYAQSEARKALRRFSTQLIHLFAKWDATPDPRLGLTLPLLRDIVFGSLEHIVWTAMVQRREDDIDVPKMARNLAAAYLRAFAIDHADPPAAVGRRTKQKSRHKLATRAAGKQRSLKRGRDGKRGSGTRHANTSPRDPSRIL